MSTEANHSPQRIHSKASIYKRVVGDTHRSLSSQRAPRSCPSDSLAVEASDDDMLILALELVLKIAARSPPFKVRFRQECRERVSSRSRVLSVLQLRGGPLQMTRRHWIFLHPPSVGPQKTLLATHFHGTTLCHLRFASRATGLSSVKKIISGPESQKDT